jgi:hypothetical protein
VVPVWDFSKLKHGVIRDRHEKLRSRFHSKQLQTVDKVLTNGWRVSFNFFVDPHLKDKQEIYSPMTAKNGFIRISSLVLILLVALPLCVAQADSESGATFTGEIMDSLCAKAGSHDQMMQDMKSMGKDKTTCSAKCIQLGGKYVLYDSSKKSIYELDDQDKAEKFAGHKVRVSGALQKKKIKVANIEAAD